MPKDYNIIAPEYHYQQIAFYQDIPSVKYTRESSTQTFNSMTEAILAFVQSRHRKFEALDKALSKMF
ncbi:MAG: hypothetical protein V2A63_00305 [Patescibacteria group bacterium]